MQLILRYGIWSTSDTFAELKKNDMLTKFGYKIYMSSGLVPQTRHRFIDKKYFTIISFSLFTIQV
jgi:hypothetical protein